MKAKKNIQKTVVSALLLSAAILFNALTPANDCAAVSLDVHEKISGNLGFVIQSEKALSEAPSSGKLKAAAAPAREKRLNIILELSQRGIDQKKLSSYGAIVRGRYKNLLGINAPAANIEDIVKNFGEIQYARLPKKFFPLAVTSEGVNLAGANTFQNLGIRGQGVKIAVLDVGFKGLSAAQSSGDLPASVTTQDYTGRGIEANYKHGTACAEIIYDMAPNASLYLLKIDDEADIYTALNYCITEGIDIVSISLGTFDGPGDGTGAICAAVDDAKNAGILIVVSAGNEALRSSEGYHWKGVFTDSDNDNINEFLQGEENNAVGAVAITDDDGNAEDGEMSVYMRWDDWPNANVDYDLYVYDYFSGALVGSSAGIQNGSQPPEEGVQLNIASGTSYYKIQVHKKSGEPAGKEVELFLGGACAFIPFGSHTSPIATSESSVTEPATAANAVAVGAIDYRNWATGPQEDFSSQGPTNAWNGNPARIKPDICGPDGVTGNTYGTGNFFGTSASAPHVAGAAALLLSANPNLNVDNLRSRLENNAIDMGTAGKDNIYGSGRLNLTQAMAYSGVVINEFLPVPTGGNVEWVELYNTSRVALNIGGFYIDDMIGGGGSPIQIPSGTIIPAGGYFTITVFNGDGYLDNNGDEVNFIMPDGTTIIDKRSYTATIPDGSYYRNPDGKEWAVDIDTTPTRGTANNGSLSDNLVAQWHMDEGSGTIANDSSGNGRHGTLNGATWTNDGISGKALSFDGVNDSLVLLGPGGGSPILVGDMQSGSVELWVKPSARIDNTSPSQGIFNSSSYGFTSRVWLAFQTDGKLLFRKTKIYDSNDNLYTNKNAWKANTWHHIIATWSGTSMSIYVDGVLDNSKNNAQPGILTTETRAVIGSQEMVSDFFKGIIDESAVYNKALSSDEAGNLYHHYKEKLPHVSALVGFYDRCYRWDSEPGWSVNTSKNFAPNGTAYIVFKVKNDDSVARSFKVSLFVDGNEVIAYQPGGAGNWGNNYYLGANAEAEKSFIWTVPLGSLAGAKEIRISVFTLVDGQVVVTDDKQLVSSAAASFNVVTDKIPVILVHGIDGNPKGFGKLEKFLEDEGYVAEPIFYSSAAINNNKNKHIANCADELKEFLSIYDTVDIITHSMGGLVTRAYRCGLSSPYNANGTLQYEFATHYDKIRRLIMIAAPNFGSNRNDFGVDVWSNYFSNADPTLWTELKWANDFAWVLNNYDPFNPESDLLISGSLDFIKSEPWSGNDGAVWHQSLHPAYINTDTTIRYPDTRSFYVKYPHIRDPILGIYPGAAEVASMSIPPEPAEGHKSWLIIKRYLADGGLAWNPQTEQPTYTKGMVIIGTYQNTPADIVALETPVVKDANQNTFALTRNDDTGNPVWYNQGLEPGEYRVTLIKEGGSPTGIADYPFQIVSKRATFLSFCLDTSYPEIEVKGNNQTIIHGDNVPRMGDYTDFGTATITGGLITRQFTVYNTGSADLVLSGTPKVEISGRNAGDFTVTSGPSSTINPGNNTSFSIQFNPSAEGLRKAYVKIGSNDSNEYQYSFSIQGTGQQSVNAAPSLAGGSVTPIAGYVTATFTYKITYYDSDNDAPASGTPTVSINGGAAVAMTKANSGDITYTDGCDYEYTLAAGTLAKGGSYNYIFAASDGTNNATGDINQHSGPTVNNSPPSINSATITGPNPAYETSTLTANGAGWSDPDGDSAGYTYQWYKNGSSSGMPTTQTCGPPNFASGDNIYCKVTPFDGTDSGAAKDTAIVTIYSSTTGAVSGHAYKTDGVTPIKGVGIGIHDYNTGNFIKSVNTDNNGYYLIPGVNPGGYKLMAYPPYGYAPEYYRETNSWDNAERVNISASATTPNINFTLDPGGEIKGYVYKEDGVTPATGISILVYASPAASQQPGFGTTSVDNNGRYAIRTGYGSHKVRITPGGDYLPEYYNGKKGFNEADIVTVSSTQDANNINFTLKPGAAITGRVLNASQQPVANVNVEYSNEEHDIGRTAVTDSEGRFSFKGLPSGVAELQAQPAVSSGYAFSLPWPCDHFYFEAPKDYANFNIIVKDGALIRGNVKDIRSSTIGNLDELAAGGKPSEWYGSSNPNGSFEFRMPKGDYKLSLWDNSYTYNALPVNFSVTDTQETLNIPDMIVYNAATGGTISGNINNPSGHNKKGSFLVAAYPAGTVFDLSAGYNLLHNPIGKYERDTPGQFVLTALPQRINYDIYLVIFGELANGLEWWAVRDADKNAALGANNLTVDYTQEGATITGKIINRDGRGVVGAIILFMDEADTEVKGFSISGKDGIYTVYNMAAGTYKIHVTHTNYDDVNSPTITVADGGTATAPDIILGSIVEDELRAAYIAYETAIESENLAALMALYKADYLDDGRTKAMEQAEFQSLFTQMQSIQLQVGIDNITIADDRAIVQISGKISATIASTGKPYFEYLQRDLHYWVKGDDKLWRLYGNHKNFDAGVETIHGSYKANFYFESPTINITGVTVTGPGVNNQPLTYDSGGREWRYTADFGTVRPGIGDLYTFTAQGTGGPYTQTEVISGIVESFATPISPINGASTGLRPTFSWTGVPGVFCYRIEVFSGTQPTFPEIWSRDIDSSQTSIVFNNDGNASGPLTSGQNYSWRIHAYDENWNSSVTNVGTFRTGTLSVVISPDTWGMGNVSPGSVTTMNPSQKITVTNNGDLTSRYSLNVVNPSVWTASTASAGDERYLMNAAFSSQLSGITWNNTNHAISTAPVAASGTKFAGDERGTGAQASQTRTLWLQFHAPLETAVTTQKNIEVIITAEEE